MLLEVSDKLGRYTLFLPVNCAFFCRTQRDGFFVYGDELPLESLQLGKGDMTRWQ